MSSRPGFFFYTNDYYADTATCSASTRGVWMDILSVMNKQGKGSLSLPQKQLQTATRCTKREIEKALMELERDGVAAIFRPKNCDLITIKSHRFTAYLEDLESKRLAEQERQKLRKEARNKDIVTEPVVQNGGSETPALVRAGGLQKTRARINDLEEGKEGAGEKGAVPNDAGRDPPSPLSIYREFYPNERLTVQQQVHMGAVTDLKAWRSALEYWVGNDHIPKNIANIVDKYRKILEERSKNGGQSLDNLKTLN